MIIRNDPANGGSHEMGKGGAGTFFCHPDTIDPREKKE